MIRLIVKDVTQLYKCYIFNGEISMINIGLILEII